MADSPYPRSTSRTKTEKRGLWLTSLMAVALFCQLLPAPARAQDGAAPRERVNRNVNPNGPAEAAEPAPIVPAGERLGPGNLPRAQLAPGVLPGGFQPEQLVSPGGLSSTLNLLVMMTVLSLAPSILMMTTCFVRFVIVFGLLRQALGTQQLPPNQVLIALSMFMTFAVMGPVWQQSYEQGIVPYTRPSKGQATVSLEKTFQNTAKPLRRFMSDQIEKTGNSETVWLFLDMNKPGDKETTAARPETYDDVPLTALLPAYMLSELKTAFIIGFQLYLPFLVIDMVVSSILMSMGMMMLPPTLISLPFKLLLFVLIDGWHLTVGMMLDSVRIT